MIHILKSISDNWHVSPVALWGSLIYIGHLTWQIMMQFTFSTHLPLVEALCFNKIFLGPMVKFIVHNSCMLNLSHTCDLKRDSLFHGCELFCHISTLLSQVIWRILASVENVYQWFMVSKSSSWSQSRSQLC